MGVEPILEHRPQQFTNHGFEGAAVGRRLAALAKRRQAGEPLAAGGGRIFGEQGRALGHRHVELEHVLLGRGLGARDPARARRGRRSGTTARVAAVLRDHALDGGQYLLHRRVLLNLAHAEDIMAYWGGAVTGGKVTGLREPGGAVRVETGVMRGPSYQSDQLRESRL